MFFADVVTPGGNNTLNDVDGDMFWNVMVPLLILVVVVVVAVATVLIVKVIKNQPDKKVTKANSAKPKK